MTASPTARSSRDSAPGRAVGASPRAHRLAWPLQLVAAAILGQSLLFKFTGAPEAVALFSTLGVEPWGRLATGVLELVTVVLLLVPRTAALGGLVAAGMMVGAVLLHLTVLGIAVEGDGGLLFALALVTLAAGTGVAWLRREQLPLVGARLAGRG